MSKARHALITGGARRIGREIALYLARHEWDITLHYNTSEEDAHALAKEIKALGREADLLQANFEKLETPGDLVQQPYDALIHNASLFERNENDPRGARHKKVNFDIPLALTEKLAKLRSQDKPAHVIFMLDNTPIPDFLSHYGASKEAVRAELGKLALAHIKTLRINAVALGPTMKAPRETSQHFEKLCRETPLQKASAPEDIARAIALFLESSSMLGTILNVDSGSHLSRREIRP